MTKPSLGYWKEFFLLLLILGLSAFLAREKIRERQLPSGDEGSWMVPAAQIIQGNGFTTNWLIKQDLKPYAVPRPDDLRFPGLVYVLAAAFLVFGTTYQTALGMMLFLHLLFLFSIYMVCRKFFNFTTAALTLGFTGLSLLQLGWNTYVLTESLFGIVTALLILWSISVSPSRWSWWAGVGIGTGLLALVKLHGLLFLPGLLLMYLLKRKEKQLSIFHLLVGVSLALIVLSPWLVRNIFIFDNPLHSAQGAWIFRYATSDPTDLTLWQFVDKHGWFVFVKKLYYGIKTLLYTWDIYDYRLARFPLLLVAVGLVRKSSFFNPFIFSGFFLLFLGSAYTCYPFWIGIRFWTPLIPFVMAYGIFQGIALLQKTSAKKRAVVISLFALLMGHHTLKAHSSYFNQERHTSGVPQAKIDSYIQNLESMVLPQEVYMAASMGQLSFSTSRLCVNIEDKYHLQEWVPRMLQTFHPQHLVLAHEESQDATIATVLREIRSYGFTLDTALTDSLAVFYTLNKSQSLKSSN